MTTTNEGNRAPRARADTSDAAKAEKRERACEAARRALRAGTTTTTTAIGASVGLSPGTVHSALAEAGLLHAVSAEYDGTATMASGRRKVRR
jgi:hypothetical protein